jgi:hypothetical protein
MTNNQLPSSSRFLSFNVRIQSYSRMERMEGIVKNFNVYKLSGTTAADRRGDERISISNAVSERRLLPAPLVEVPVVSAGVPRAARQRKLLGARRWRLLQSPQSGVSSRVSRSWPLRRGRTCPRGPRAGLVAAHSGGWRATDDEVCGGTDRGTSVRKKLDVGARRPRGGM